MGQGVTMILHEPIVITSRLCAGVLVGGGEISIDYSRKAGDDGRTRYHYWIDAPDGSVSGCALQSDCQGGHLQGGLASLISFLLWGGDLFPVFVIGWVRRNKDELSGIELDLSETPNLIEE
jgi:hypothetical protein